MFLTVTCSVLGAIHYPMQTKKSSYVIRILFYHTWLISDHLRNQNAIWQIHWTTRRQWLIFLWNINFDIKVGKVLLCLVHYNIFPFSVILSHCCSETTWFWYNQFEFLLVMFHWRIFIFQSFLHIGSSGGKWQSMNHNRLY